jgi:LCP family protein required for cell wall assembly
VPRDMYLKTACSNGNYRRINTTTWGSSSSCAVKTIESLFDVDIDYYAKINFKGVVQLVNAVGGIDVNVDYSICEQNSSRKWGKNTVFVEKGKQHLNGEQALALARNRHKPNYGSYIGDKMAQYCPTYNKGTRNDFTRGKNQMKIIMGIANAAVKTKDPNKLLSIMDSIKKNFQTNITSKDILKLYNLAKSMVISDSTNLVNIERLQLAGYNVNVTGGITIFDPVLGKYKEDYGYPQVTIPYKGSIEDIKDAIKNNLNNTSIKAITKISFDIDNPYTTTIIGDKTYKEDKVTTLKNLSSYSLDEIRTYASKNGLSVKFIDKDTNKEINDLDSYTFSSQKEHVYTILDQIDTLTIYVKQKITYNEQIEETQSTE